MSLLPLYTAHFEGHTLHTLLVDERPAWIARELGTLLGYSHEGKPLAAMITSDWSSEFIAGQDYALLTGEQLSALALCEEPSPTHSLLVLFESGMHIALAKPQMPGGQRLRCFLVDEVLPKLSREDEDGDESLLERVVVIRGLRADVEDRKFRYRSLRQTADTLHELGHIDESTWSHCLVRACEFALGQPFPLLHAALGWQWLTLAELAKELGVQSERVLEAARALGLLERSRYARPVASRETDGWRLTFRLAPEAASLVSAWLAEQDMAAPLDPADA